MAEYLRRAVPPTLRVLAEDVDDLPTLPGFEIALLDGFSQSRHAPLEHLGQLLKGVLHLGVDLPEIDTFNDHVPAPLSIPRGRVDVQAARSSNHSAAWGLHYKKVALEVKPFLLPSNICLLS